MGWERSGKNREPVQFGFMIASQKQETFGSFNFPKILEIIVSSVTSDLFLQTASSGEGGGS